VRGQAEDNLTKAKAILGLYEGMLWNMEKSEMQKRNVLFQTPGFSESDGIR